MDAILANTNSITVVAILLTALITGSKGMWLFGFQSKRETDRLEKLLTDNITTYETRITEIKTDRDEWKSIALSATDIGKRVAHVAEKSVTHR